MSGSYGGHAVGEEVSNKILLSYCGLNRHKQHLWNWECSKCNNHGGPATISHLNRSDSCKSCRGENNKTWRGYKEISGVFIGQCRWNASKKNREFSVSPEYLWEIWEMQDGRCRYSGRKLTHGVNASIDRINSSNGYVTGNIQWVHKDINRIKSDFQEAEFLSICKEVADFSAGRL